MSVAPTGQSATSTNDRAQVSANVVAASPVESAKPDNRYFDHRHLGASRNAAFSELLFGEPVLAIAYTSPVIGRPILSARLEIPAADIAGAAVRIAALPRNAPLPQTAALPEAVQPPAPEEALADFVPLPPVNPFRNRTGERSVVARTLPAVNPAQQQAAASPDASEPGFFQRLFAATAQPPAQVMAYAPVNDERANPLRASPFRQPAGGDRTAVYVIEARTVFMPDGTKLEAHSGLGPKKDDPRYVHVRMNGATPPNTYNLVMRERRFHGVEAIRMLPLEPGRMHGRDGILAHSYLLGPGGDSHGCVSFADYNKFLNAFKRGEVTRLVVVANASSMLAMNAARAGQ